MTSCDTGRHNRHPPVFHIVRRGFTKISLVCFLTIYVSWLVLWVRGRGLFNKQNALQWQKLTLTSTNEHLTFCVVSIVMSRGQDCPGHCRQKVWLCNTFSNSFGHPVEDLWTFASLSASDHALVLMFQRTESLCDHRDQPTEPYELPCIDFGNQYQYLSSCASVPGEQNVQLYSGQGLCDQGSPCNLLEKYRFVVSSHIQIPLSLMPA